MATTDDEVFYTMGQIRYRSSSEYVTQEDVVVRSVQLSEDNTFRDIVIVPKVEDINEGNKDISFVYEANKPYYLRLAIPKNVAYAMTLTLELCNTRCTGSGAGYDEKVLDSPTYASGSYQIIKRILVPRAVLDEDAYNRVILYPKPNDDDNGEVQVAIVREYNAGNSEKNKDEWITFQSIVEKYDLKVGDIVYNGFTQEYYFIVDEKVDPAISKIESDGKENYSVALNKNLVNKRNDAILTHIWKQSTTAEKAIFEMVFTSRYETGSFNTIIAKLRRDSWDADIHYTLDNDASGTIYTGLRIEPEDVDVYVGKITNLLNNSTDGAQEETVNSIGIWGHPNLITTINGEEIRVGQSGYYELNDFDINFFGVVALDGKDKFTADYQTVIDNG